MQITYKEKVTLQSNPNIPDENKVTAKDMNEIKSVVNSNEEEQQALNMSVQEIAQNVANNSQEISNIKEEQTTQNDNIQTNSNNISDLQSNKADKSEIPTDLSQLSNENTKFVNETGLENAISQEKTQRQNADNNLQNQVDTNKTNIQTNATNIATNTQGINTIKAEQTTQNNRLNSLEVDNTTNKSDILTNKQEINNIKTEQTEQNTNISTNATNIESLQEENENLKKIVNQLPQVEGTGTEITLENTIEAQFTKFDVEGNSEQETTTGKNKVDVTSGNLYSVPETLTLTQREDGRLFLNGKMNGTTTQLIFNMNFANIENGKTYKIVTKVVSGTWDKSIIGMQFRNSNGQQIQTLQNSSSAQESKVIEGDVAEVRLYFGGTFEATNLVIEIMLVEASVTDDSFEKFTYGASPNPNYEQPILSAGDNENILPNTATTQIISGVEFIANKNGSIKLNGTATENINYSIVGKDSEATEVLFLKANQNYYNCTNLRLVYRLVNGNYGAMNSGSYTPSNDLSIRHVYLSITSGTSFTNEVIYPKLQKGNKASGYSPYGMGSINEKIKNADGTEEQDYSIYTQQPFRSIGDVRDIFFKNTVDSPYYDENLTLNGWYERHLPYIASYNGEILPQDVYNEVDNVKYCNEKSMSTTGQFSIGASVQYIDENNWNDLPCTETQIQQLENKPSTHKEMTIINSEDETEAYLEVSGIYDLNKLITRTEVLESES